MCAGAARRLVESGRIRRHVVFGHRGTLAGSLARPSPRRHRPHARPPAALRGQARPAAGAARRPRRADLTRPSARAPRAGARARWSRLGGRPASQGARRARPLAPGHAAEVERDAALRAAPAGPPGRSTPACSTSTSTWRRCARRAGPRRASTSWWPAPCGASSRLDDRIPAYRLAMGARLPALRTPGLAAWWRPR